MVLPNALHIHHILKTELLQSASKDQSALCFQTRPARAPDQQAAKVGKGLHPQLGDIRRAEEVKELTFLRDQNRHSQGISSRNLGCLHAFNSPPYPLSFAPEPTKLQMSGRD
jgi:hypothetical protein